MKSDNTIRNGTSIFVGIIVAIAAFVRGALLLPLLLVACSIWGLYVLHHLRGSLPAVPKKKAKAPRRAKFVVPDIEDEPLSDILLLHVNQRTSYGGQQHHMGMGHQRSACHRQRRRTLPDSCSRIGRL